jgi:hypothetical protein
MSHQINYEQIKAFLDSHQPKIHLASSGGLKKLEVDHNRMYFVYSPYDKLQMRTHDLKDAINFYNNI